MHIPSSVELASWFVFLLLALYFTVVIASVTVVVRENRNPIRALSWVIALLFLPGVGLVFYLFFGRSMRGLHMISRHSKRKIMHDHTVKRVNVNELGLSPENRNLVKLAHTLCRAPLTVNNEVEIFTDGPDKFASLKLDLENAKSSILLQYYIFLDDRTGIEIAEILKQKAREGLTVKVIYDHVGSFSASNDFFRQMRMAGVEIHPFFRVNFPHFANRVNWRNHRKIVVIDGKVGYIGGMNIADRYNLRGEDGTVWRDTHFRVTGDIVESLLYSFVIDWNFLKKEPYVPVVHPVSAGVVNNTGMQLVTGGPTERWNNLSLCFLRAISSARKSIYIQTPYFLPTDALFNALQAAALSKIDVRIMIPRKPDSALLRYASFSYVKQCLRSGINVYLYEPGMLHAKAMIIDDEFVTAGSTNFDFRSFENNFECNLLIYDKKVNEKMRAIFFEDLNNCTKLNYTEWKHRKLSQKVLESILRLVSPIL